MQILMSEAAHGRVGGALAEIDPTADVVTIDAAGGLKRGGEVVPANSVDPEIFWVSLDMYQSGQLPNYFRQMLRGTSENGRRPSTPGSTARSSPASWARASA